MLLTDWQQRFHASRVLGADANQAEQYVRLMAENKMGSFARQLHDKGPCVFGSEDLGSATRSRIEQCAARHGPGILLIGDSHAIDLHNAMASMADAEAAAEVEEPHRRRRVLRQPQRELRGRLAEAGYVAVDQVLEHGEMEVAGPSLGADQRQVFAVLAPGVGIHAPKRRPILVVEERHR